MVGKFGTDHFVQICSWGLRVYTSIPAFPDTQLAGRWNQWAKMVVDAFSFVHICFLRVVPHHTSHRELLKETFHHQTFHSNLLKAQH